MVDNDCDYKEQLKMSDEMNVVVHFEVVSVRDEKITQVMKNNYELIDTICEIYSSFINCKIEKTTGIENIFVMEIQI